MDGSNTRNPCCHRFNQNQSPDIILSGKQETPRLGQELGNFLCLAIPVKTNMFFDLECTNQITQEGGVPCRNEEPEGTAIGVLFFSSCEGGPIRHDSLAELLERVTLGDELFLHSVVGLMEPERPAFAPRGEIGVIVELRETGRAERGLMFEANQDGKLISVYQGCGLTAPEILGRLTTPGVIVPPPGP